MAVRATSSFALLIFRLRSRVPVDDPKGGGPRLPIPFDPDEPYPFELEDLPGLRPREGGFAEPGGVVPLEAEHVDGYRAGLSYPLKPGDPLVRAAREAGPHGLSRSRQRPRELDVGEVLQSDLTSLPADKVVPGEMEHGSCGGPT